MNKSRKALLIGIISQVVVFLLLLLAESKIPLLIVMLIYYVFAPGLLATTYFYSWLYPAREILFSPFVWFINAERQFALMSFVLNWLYYSSVAYLILSIRERLKHKLY